MLESLCTEVPLPSEFGLPYYEDLELQTPDNIKLRCYLLPQKRSLSATHAEAAPLPDEQNYRTEEEVFFKFAVAFLTFINRPSSFPVARPS